MNSSFQLTPPPRAPLDGLRLDIPPEGRLDPRAPEPCPAWITLQNMLMSQGKLITRPGWKKVGTTPDGCTVKLICPIFYQGGATANLIVTTENAYLYTNNGQFTPVASALTMTAERFPEIDFLLGQYYVLVPGTGLFSFNGVSNFAKVDTSAGIPANVLARHLVAFAQHLILSNFDGPNTGVDATNSYSALGSGTTIELVNGLLDWNTGNTDSEATTFQIPYKGWPIQRMMELGSGLLAIYKSRSISNAWYNGSIAQDIYDIPDPQVSERGLQAPASLIDMGGYHTFLGNDDLYTYDGNSITGFGRKVWQAWMAQMKAGAAAGIYAFDDERSPSRNILYAFQAANTPASPYSQAMVWNYLYDAFSQIDWPFTAVGFILSGAAQSQLALAQQQLAQGRMSDTDSGGSETVDEYEDFALLTGDAQGNLYVIDGTQPLNAPAVLETGDWAPAGVERRSLWNGMAIDCPSLTGTPLQVYVSQRRRLGDPVIYPAAPTASYVPSQRWVNFMGCDVWTRIKFVKADGTMDFRGWAARVRGAGYY
jgi:hypothetical protein